ncbi:MAG: hypothetical protein P8079_09740, partial [Gammaproteobacteria bacterium]
PVGGTEHRRRAGRKASAQTGEKRWEPRVSGAHVSGRPFVGDFLLAAQKKATRFRGRGLDSIKSSPQAIQVDRQNV